MTRAYSGLILPLSPKSGLLLCATIWGSGRRRRLPAGAFSLVDRRNDSLNFLPDSGWKPLEPVLGRQQADDKRHPASVDTLPVQTLVENLFELLHVNLSHVCLSLSASQLPA
jgi:hypothetical protein